MSSRHPATALLTGLLSVAVLASCAASGGGPTEPSAASSGGAAANLKSAPLNVVSAQFGVFGADPAGRRVLFETNNFPAITAAPYGWYIIFKTDKPTVVWREEFELPHRSKTGAPARPWASTPSRPTARRP
jgi:hypothetical protein